MLYRRSLRANFLYKLSIAMAVLVFITSSSLYIYIRLSSNYELESELYKKASFLLENYKELPKVLEREKENLKNSLIEAKIGHINSSDYKPNYFEIVKEGKKYFLKGYFPYDFKNNTYLILSQDITKPIKLENKLYNAVIFINIISLIVIIVYAFLLSKMLIKPINTVSKNIAKMSQDTIKEIDIKNLPYEFEPLGFAINNLLTKIKNYTYYQKELFIGAAHELKTPLAVMKTKSQVALIKRNKSVDSLKEALEQNIESINSLNSTIESILAYGRAEGAQFQRKEEIDIAKFINEIILEHEIVAVKEEKYILKRCNLPSLKILIQPALIRIIIQNLMQNALRFTPKGEYIEVISFICKDNLVIRVKNYGVTLPKDFDIFAPFKKGLNSKGTGLGLFLAQNAASTLNAKLTICNQKKHKGVVASVIIPIGICC